MNKQGIMVTLFLLGNTLIWTGCQSSVTPAPTPRIAPQQIAEPNSIFELPRVTGTPVPARSLEPPIQSPSIQIPTQMPSKVPLPTSPTKKGEIDPKSSSLPKVMPKSHNTKIHRAPNNDSSRKIAYLTFDDGPSRVTGHVLNTLKRYKVKATFFVIGNASLEGRALYKRIIAEGHTIGNHSFSHNYKEIYKSVATFERDVTKLNKLLEQTISFRPDIIRFPGGSNNTVSYRAGGRNIMSKIASDVTEQGYQYFDWNVDSSDASGPVRSKTQIISSIKRGVGNKDRIIVLMHDAPNRISTADALPDIIEFLISKGYRFEKLNKSTFTWQFLHQ